MQVNPEEAKLAQWTTCRLSGDRLSRPVCTDELGLLYNKSAVVAGLVAKSLPPKLAHITSLKHLIELKLEDNKVRLLSFAKNECARLLFSQVYKVLSLHSSALWCKLMQTTLWQVRCAI